MDKVNQQSALVLFVSAGMCCTDITTWHQSPQHLTVDRLCLHVTPFRRDDGQQAGIEALVATCDDYCVDEGEVERCFRGGRGDELGAHGRGVADAVEE